MDLPLTAVTTTGIFCRAGCPAPSPHPEHIEQMATAREALFAGYRPCPLVAGRHRHLVRLQSELDEYFAGRRSTFGVALVAPGSPFQERTWAELRRIPPGSTISYEQLAERVGRPGAQRAVGTPNGANRVAIVIPCHRVVRKSGETGNYGGGRWRKEWLLAQEQRIVETDRRMAATPVIQQSGY